MHVKPLHHNTYMDSVWSFDPKQDAVAFHFEAGSKASKPLQLAKESKKS